MERNYILSRTMSIKEQKQCFQLIIRALIIKP